MNDSLNFEVVDKPWGGYKRFTLNMPSTVKVLKLESGQRFSLQTHSNREEFWHILDGEALITVGDKTLDAKPGDEFFIKVGELHRAEAKDNRLRILEIAFGKFDETDITRVEDDYGRN